MSAGGSQLVQSVEASLDAAALEKQAVRSRSQARRNRAGCVGEREVCAALSKLALSGVQHLDDRRWGADTARKANLDHLVIAPSGVFVLDAKNWAGRIEVRGTQLLQDGIARDHRLVALRWMLHRVEEVLATTTAAHVRPQALVCFARPARNLPSGVGTTLLATLDSLGSVICDRPAVLAADQMSELADALDFAFPPYEVDAQAAAEAEGLLFPDEVTRNAGLKAALAQPVEDWMVWLHPTQASIVHRSFPGPARVRGSAGTGKTSVALHRVAWLAATRPGRFLVTSFVRTLPESLSSAYARLSPSTADRVDFVHVHAVASELVHEAGLPGRIDTGNTAFAVAWRRASAGLEGSSLSREYFREEITYVIKGRGLESQDGYLALDRVGRRTALQPEQRAKVWALAKAYDEELASRGQIDFTDVLRLARDLAARQPQSRWRGVVVDEVQDIPMVGLQLLHHLAGRDKSDGLLLVGDGQQMIYPGGFKLAEAGISVAGRGVVLKVNYRNTVEVLAAARAIVAGDTYEDLDLLGQPGERDTEVVRHGELPVSIAFDSVEEHDSALLWDLQRRLDQGADPRGVAVLCQTNGQVDEYVTLLTAGGVPAVALSSAKAARAEAVMVGTWARAKGLEFAHVFIPQANRRSLLLTGGGEAASLEKAELFRRQQYVAMTRARDTLWVGRVAEPSIRSS